MEICPEAINITHSAAAQTRHIIIRNTSNAVMTLCASLPLHSPCLSVTAAEKNLVEITRTGKLVLRLPPAERLIVRILYNPLTDRQYLTEDGIVIFADSAVKPVVVRISCLPTNRGDWAPCSSAKLYAKLDLTYPVELQHKGRLSTPEMESDSDPDDDEASTYLEGTGWVNDYGEVVSLNKSHAGVARPRRLSKTQLISNWESLKRSCN